MLHSSTSFWKYHYLIFDWASLVAQVKAPACQCGKAGFDPWVRKIPWRRKWQRTPVSLPGESHGGRNLVSYTVHGVAKGRTRPSDFTFIFLFSFHRNLHILFWSKQQKTKHAIKLCMVSTVQIGKLIKKGYMA